MLKIIGILLLILTSIPAILFTGYGLVLAFSASVVLGFIVLILEPSPLILGLIAFFGDKPNICEDIAHWLGLL